MVIRPIELLVPLLVNHSAPSGPAVIPVGLTMPVPVEAMVTVPEVVIRPIEPVPYWPPAWLVNHSAPSGPAVIPNGSSIGTGMPLPLPV